MYGIGCSYTGCVVSIQVSVEKQDGVLIYRMSCLYTGWGVSKRDDVLINGMGCYFPGRGVNIRDGVLANRIKC